MTRRSTWSLMRPRKPRQSRRKGGKGGGKGRQKSAGQGAARAAARARQEKRRKAEGQAGWRRRQQAKGKTGLQANAALRSCSTSTAFTRWTACCARTPSRCSACWVQQGREDKRIAALLELAQNQGVPVAREPRRTWTRWSAAATRVWWPRRWMRRCTARRAANLWREADLLQAVENKTGRADPGAGRRHRPPQPGRLPAQRRCRGGGCGGGAQGQVGRSHPGARKVACGAAEVVPFVRVTNYRRTLQALKERGVWLFGAAGEAEKSIYDNDLTAPWRW